MRKPQDPQTIGVYEDCIAAELPPKVKRQQVPVEDIPHLGVVPNTAYWRRRLQKEERFYVILYGAILPELS